MLVLSGLIKAPVRLGLCGEAGPTALWDPLLLLWGFLLAAGLVMMRLGRLRGVRAAYRVSTVCRERQFVDLAGMQGGEGATDINVDRFGRAGVAASAGADRGSGRR